MLTKSLFIRTFTRKPYGKFESITLLADLLGVDWHDRQNRVIFTTNERQPRRVDMFRINSRDELIRVFINDLVLDSTESKIIISMCDNHIVHDDEQITTRFYNTCFFTFDSFNFCLQALRDRLK